MRMGHRPGASADLRQNKLVSQVVPQRTSLPDGRKPKFMSCPQSYFFFFQLRTTWQQKCLKGLEDNLLLEKIGLGV